MAGKLVHDKRLRDVMQDGLKFCWSRNRQNAGRQSRRSRAGPRVVPFDLCIVLGLRGEALEERIQRQCRRFGRQACAAMGFVAPPRQEFILRGVGLFAVELSAARGGRRVPAFGGVGEDAGDPADDTVGPTRSAA
jgi:hypothetical protein